MGEHLSYFLLLLLFTKKISAVKRFILDAIKVFVYIINVCVLFTFIMHM